MRPQRDLTIVVDSNVFIALEDLGYSNEQLSLYAAEFSRLASELGATIAISSATRADLAKASPEKRTLRETQLLRYFVIESVPQHSGLLALRGSLGSISTNDEADLGVLSTLASGAADWLVTEDVRLRKLATRAGYGGSVYSLAGVIETLSAYVPHQIASPTVTTVKGYELDVQTEFFGSIKNDYPDFEIWWQEKVAKGHRDVLVLGSPKNPEGVAVMKIELDIPHGLKGKILKTCMFKTSEMHQGVRRGELLLMASIEYGRRNACDAMYMEVLERKQGFISWLDDFGFREVAAHTARGEVVLAKHLTPTPSPIGYAPLEHNIAYGPGSVRIEAAHLVPIQPQFHKRLFPDAETQYQMFPRTEACGNAIRKAYLCNASSRQIQAGHCLIFLRTRGTTQATAIGVAESTLASQSAEEIVAFVGNRTVYSIDEIRELCEKTEVLAVQFRWDRVLDPPWPKAELERANVLRGNVQSIQRVPQEGLQWIRSRLEESS